jgi:hypothetical protein
VKHFLKGLFKCWIQDKFSELKKNRKVTACIRCYHKGCALKGSSGAGRVIGDLLGRWAAILVIVNIGLSLFGTCVAQVVASSADAYYITQTIDKRSAPAPVMYSI